MKKKKIQCLIAMVFILSFESMGLKAQNSTMVFTNFKASTKIDAGNPQHTILELSFKSATWNNRNILKIQLGTQPALGNLSTQIATISENESQIFIFLSNGKKFLIQDNQAVLEIPIGDKEKQLLKYVTISSLSQGGNTSNKVSAAVQ